MLVGSTVCWSVHWSISSFVSTFCLSFGWLADGQSLFSRLVGRSNIPWLAHWLHSVYIGPLACWSVGLFNGLVSQYIDQLVPWLCSLILLSVSRPPTWLASDCLSPKQFISLVGLSLSMLVSQSVL